MLGYVEPYGIIHGDSCTWLQTQFGVPVEEAFRQAMALADNAGVPLLLIDDPQNLFPDPPADIED